MKRIYLYGLANAENRYKAVRHSYIDEYRLGDNIDIVKEMKACASWMKNHDGRVEHVYAMSMRPGLAYDYKRAWMTDTIESNVIFKDILEREGLLIL